MENHGKDIENYSETSETPSILEKIAASFISHEHSDLDSDFILQVPEFIKIFSWTIRDRIELHNALEKSDNITFEGFSP